MKIGILIDELISGGFQKVAVMETIGFMRLGHEARLIVLHRTENLGYQDLIHENNVEVIFLSDRLPKWLKINFKFPLFSFFSFFHISYYFFIDKYIGSDEFDVFITHGTYTAFSSISISQRKNIPYLAFIHDPISYILKQKYTSSMLRFFLPVLLPLGKLLDKKIILNSKNVIAYAEMVDVMKALMPNARTYISIFNGCEPIKKDNIQFKKNNYAIAATKWDQGKNMDFLIDIWAKLNKRIPLKIVGTWAPDDLRIRFMNRLKERGLEKDMEVIGRVSEKELSDYYQKAKFLIHPCREAFGMTILEAAANGCVSIFTSNSGVASMFEDFNLYLVEENNLADYIKKIEHLLKSNSSDEHRYIEEYHKISLNHSWEKHCKKIIAEAF